MPKVHCVLSQQMKSNDCLFEDGDLLHVSPTPSNSVAHYNNYCISMLNNNKDNALSIRGGDATLCHLSHPSLTRPLTNSNNASTLSIRGYVESLCPLLQRSALDPPLCESGGNSQLPAMNWFCSYFGNFSQSTACNAVGFGECSSTLLDKLWYTYSYIYKPTTTICYGIYIFFNSQHTGPFRLLPCVKHTTTPSASSPFFPTRSFTTRSTLQLLILLESAFTPSLSVTSGTFFVNFFRSIIFLYLVGVDNEDNDLKSTTRPDIQYEFESLHASPFWLLALLKPTTPIISIPLCTTSSTLHLLAFSESTVPSLPLPLWAFFVIFFLSPVGPVTLLRLISSSGIYATHVLRSARLTLLSYSTTTYELPSAIHHGIISPAAITNTTTSSP